MKIYHMTDIGESEASTPVANPSPARRVLYYLYRKTNNAASDDQIADSVFQGDKSQASVAMSRLMKARAVEIIGR